MPQTKRKAPTGPTGANKKVNPGAIQANAANATNPLAVATTTPPPATNQPTASPTPAPPTNPPTNPSTNPSVSPCPLASGGTVNPQPAISPVIKLDCSNPADASTLQGFSKTVATTSKPALQSNTEYQVDYKDKTGGSHMTSFFTNKDGQPVKTTFSLAGPSDVRPPNERIATSNQTVPLGAPLSGKNDVGFHAKGDQFYGPPYYPNLDPGDAVLNNSDYKSLEMKLGKAAKNGITSDTTVEKHFSQPTDVRPDSFTVKSVLTKPDGTTHHFTHTFLNDAPGNDPNRPAFQKKKDDLKKFIG